MSPNHFLCCYQAAAKPKKVCLGKNGNKYKVGQSYEDSCVKYTCKKKGRKYVAKPLDRERRSSYTFTVSALDQVQSPTQFFSVCFLFKRKY